MRTTTVIIGAGQAGLAMSRCLTERSIDHVLLERGEVANSWRSGRWDSLRLLTPNWQSRVTPVPSGSHLAVRMELIPRGPARLLQPLLRRRMQGRELDNMRAIKNTMESLAAR
jgi:cation diffusion facilitator CzcD-associated flavoprotein CzcO